VRYWSADAVIDRVGLEMSNSVTEKPGNLRDVEQWSDLLKRTSRTDMF